MIDILKEKIITNLLTLDWLENPDKWNSLDIDYYPPRVERLFTDLGDYRLSLHVIHKTDQECLFHKHKWPSAMFVVKGQYEMGVSYSELEVPSEEVYKLPMITKLILNEGSFYEMTNTHGFHYVKPLTEVSLSIMLSGKPYPESRKEVVNKELLPLTDERKKFILDMFRKETVL